MIYSLILAVVAITQQVIPLGLAFVFAQASEVAPLGSLVAGYGFGGVLAWMLIIGRLRPGADYDKMQQERNDAIAEQITTLREVIPLVVKSNELVTNMAAQGHVSEEAVDRLIRRVLTELRDETG